MTKLHSVHPKKGRGHFDLCLLVILTILLSCVIYYIIRRLVNHSIRKKNLTTVTEAYVEAAGVNEATGAIIYYGEKQKKKRTLKDSGKKDETKKNQ